MPSEYGGADERYRFKIQILQRYRFGLSCICTAHPGRNCDGVAMPTDSDRLLYERIAQRIAQDLDSDIYRPGERLPGVRKLAGQYGVSIATVLEACRRLEDGGRLKARPRSGFFVLRTPRIRAREPAISNPPRMPSPVSGQEMALQLAKAANDPAMIGLGAAVPHARFMPMHAVERALARSVRERGQAAANYAFPPGEPALRRQIARRMAALGCAVAPEEIVITTGCHEALRLALKAVTRPGDTVAIESPTFYGLLQVIDSLGLKALEIPTHPRDGISLEALDFALDQWPVAACIVTPNFSNPLGSLMDETRKRALVRLLAARGIALIEDDVYGELHHRGERPGICLAHDTQGATVLHCASVSKTLSPGLRVGWIVPGRHLPAIEFQKYLLNLATPTVPQMAVAELLEHGNYDRHLRQARKDYAEAVERMRREVERLFPDGTRVTQPEGGFVLWVEFPAGIDGEVLYRTALTEGISIAPGPIFSATRKYRNCIRLNCAIPWDARVERALARLGQMAQLQLAAGRLG